MQLTLNGNKGPESSISIDMYVFVSIGCSRRASSQDTKYLAEEKQ